MGCHSLLQGIFATQGLNPGHLHCRQVLLPSERPGKLSNGVNFPQNVFYRPHPTPPPSNPAFDNSRHVCLIFFYLDCSPVLCLSYLFSFGCSGSLLLRGLSSLVAVYRLLIAAASLDSAYRLSFPTHMGSSQTRDRTWIFCIGRQIIYHGATREAPLCLSWAWCFWRVLIGYFVEWFSKSLGQCVVYQISPLSLHHFPFKINK